MTSKDGFTYRALANGTVQVAETDARFAIATLQYAFGKYTKEAAGDTYSDQKTYYKLADGKYSVFAVADGDAYTSNKNDLYTRADASEVEIAALADQSIGVRVTGGNRTRVIDPAKKPVGQTQENWAAKTGDGTFQNVGVGSHHDLVITISGGAPSWSGSNNTVCYSISGTAASTDLTSTQIGNKTTGYNKNDGDYAAQSSLDGHSLQISFYEVG